MAAALDTFSDLQTSVYSRLNRGANSTDFGIAIALAEAEINRRLALNPVRPMQVHTTAAISAEYEAVPTDILDVESLAINGDAVTATSPQNIEQMAAKDPAQPRYYAQIGSQFRFYPAPDQSYTLDITYWAKVPNLNATATTNWLLTDHPDVYFHGILAHLHQQYFDEKAAQTHAALFSDALDKVLSAYPNRSDTRPLRSEISPNQLSGWRLVLV